MARPREFDSNLALEKAMQVFWEHGYNATSITDLTQSMGLLRGSVYAAFGDKHQLFLAVLERYMENAINNLKSILNQPGSPKQAVCTAITCIARNTVSSNGQKGCFVTNMTLELLPDDVEVKAKVTQHYRRMEDLFTEALTRAQAAGEINPNHDCRALGLLLVCMIQGLRVLGKTSLGEQQLLNSVNAMLEVIN